MAFQWMRRALLALAPAALLALTACGSGTIESQFHPARAVVFGDGLSDMGNLASGNRYTVNDTSLIWANIVAVDYGITLTKSSAGGTDYAMGNARVALEPDAAGGTATLTVKEQIDAFLAAHGSFNSTNDLVIIQGGISDLIVQMQAFRAGTITADEMVANARQAGRDLAAQAKRLVAAGALHVVVIGTYDLGKTPWATSIAQQTLLSNASQAFNNGLLVDLVDQGSNMLYVDIGLLVNLMNSAPQAYGFGDATTVACNSVDAGPGIGIGTGQVNSALCTTSTIATGVNYNVAMWADPVYPTPLAHSTIANYVFTRVHDRW
jgi:phospholipase/lecithinase/hemolysin